MTVSAPEVSYRSALDSVPRRVIESDNRTRKQRFQCLTALCFFPVLFIVFHHSQNSFTCWQHMGEMFNLSQATSFFFVFAGFVLAHNYSNIREKDEIARFYLGRIVRIWPQHIFTLLLLIAILPEVFRVTKSQIPMFLCNLTLLQSWVPTWKIFYSYNAASWTCSTLVVMNMIFPFLARAVKSSWSLVVAGAATLAIGACVFCNLLNLPECQPDGWSALGVMYVNPVSRLLEFVVGMVAANFFGKSLSKVTLAIVPATVLELCCIVLIVLSSLSSHTVRAATIPWASNAGSLWIANSGLPMLPCTALIVVLAMESGLISKILSWRPLVFLGSISFSMFLLHCVFLAYLGVRHPTANSPQDALVYVAILFASSYALTMVFDSPVRSLLLKFGDKLLETRRMDQEIGFGR